jgi:putative membrane protein insertion efficiency factor
MSRGVVGWISHIPRFVLLTLINFYRACISPHFPACCRYIPTCSQYALTAVERFGALRGGWLTLKRILRCNPFHAGGFDPVPDSFSFAGHSK